MTPCGPAAFACLPAFLPTDSYWSRWSRKGQQEALEKGEVFEGLRNSQPPKPSQPRCLPCTFDDTGGGGRGGGRRLDFALVHHMCAWPAPATSQATGSPTSEAAARAAGACLHPLRHKLHAPAGLDLQRAHAFKTCNCTAQAMHAAFKRLLTGANQWRDFPRTPPVRAAWHLLGSWYRRGSSSAAACTITWPQHTSPACCAQQHVKRATTLPRFPSCLSFTAAPSSLPPACGLRSTRSTAPAAPCSVLACCASWTPSCTHHA